MQAGNTQEHTQLVTEYIELQDAWRSAVRAAMRGDTSYLFRLDRAEADMLALAVQFTAAQWAELHARRA